MPMHTANRAVLGLLALLGALYLLGNDSIHLWDRDEPRYAQTSRQMLQSGDWVVPRFLDKVRTAKPVLIYWCQAAAMSVLGDTPFAARLPSAVGMVLTLGLVGWAVQRISTPRHAFWTVLVLGTSILPISAAKMCVTDAVLLLWITIAQMCLWSVWRGDRSWTTPVVWAAVVGLAGLTKGPVILGVQATTLLALWALGKGIRESGISNLKSQISDPSSFAPRLAKLVVALLIVAAIVGPWLYLVERRAPGFLGTTISHDVLNRTLRPLEGHQGPPGYYLLTIWGTFLPWSLLLPTAILLAWGQRARPEMRFALAAVVGPWAMFEIVQTKLPHYLLPVYPALALLCADALLRCARGESRLMDWRPFRIGAAVWAAAIVLVGLAPWLAMRYFSDLPIAAMVAFSLVAIAYAGSVHHLFHTGRHLAGGATMGLGMILLMGLASGWFLPRAQYLRLSESLAAVLKNDGATRPGEVVMVGYREPSLGFYQGGTIREGQNNRPLQAVPPDQWPRWIVMSLDMWNRTPADIRGQWAELATLRGLNLAAGGQIAEVVVARRRE